MPARSWEPPDVDQRGHARVAQNLEERLGVKLQSDERRYDIGNFRSYFETFIEFALADPEYGEDLRRTLRRLC